MYTIACGTGVMNPPCSTLADAVDCMSVVLEFVSIDDLQHMSCVDKSFASKVDSDRMLHKIVELALPEFEFSVDFFCTSSSITHHAASP
jgi:hypothetical protein